MARPKKPKKLVCIEAYVDAETRRLMARKRGERGLISNSAYVRQLIEEDVRK